jgi:predicted dinucleotide-binding enzyme
MQWLRSQPFVHSGETGYVVSSISIVGLGNMASALAATLGSATAGTAATTPAGDIVILAVPYAHAAAVVSQYGDALDGKIVVDITNPMTTDFQGLLADLDNGHHFAGVGD